MSPNGVPRPQWVNAIPSHWNYTGSWNPSSRGVIAYLCYIVNTINVDNLATQGTRSTAIMILISFAWTNSKLKRLLMMIWWFHCFKIIPHQSNNDLFFEMFEANTVLLVPTHSLLKVHFKCNHEMEVIWSKSNALWKCNNWFLSVRIQP